VLVHRIKLRSPQLLPTWIERPHLERRLDEHVRVYAATAGPGYGKSVLAARLHAAWPGLKLWYSLDESDADLAAFAMHFDALLDTIGRSTAVEGDAWRLSSPKDLGRVFAESLADAPEPVLIVFDDVHTLAASRSLTALGELVERAARVGVTFVLCGRTLPLSLHAFGAAGSLVQLGAADLAFDDDEVRTYFEHTADTAVIPATGDLVRQAEGWPAGLALIGSANTGGTRGPRGGAAPARDDEARQLLFDYLANEALAGLSDEERDFLLATSIMDRLEVDLCDEVLDRLDAAALFGGFAKRGLFVVRRADDGFSYHQLFREFLQQTLLRSRPASEVAALHRRIARGLIARGLPAEASAHLFDAGDAGEAIALFEREAISLLRLGLVATVGALVARMAPDAIERSPTLLLALGRVQRERGEWDAALTTLERAIRAARSARAYVVVAESVRACATILASRGEFDRLHAMVDGALAIGEHLSEESLTTLRMTQAAMYVETSRGEEALAIFGEITPSVIARGDFVAQGSVLHNTAVAHLRRGDVFAGLAMYERALKLKRSSGQRASSLLTLADLVYSHILLGNFDDAERLSDELLTEARDIGSNGVVAHGLESRATIRLARGDLDGAERALDEAQRICDPSDVLVMPDILHGLARCALARGADGDADERCSAAIRLFGVAGRYQQVAPILLTRAAILERRGRYAEAVAQAIEAADDAGRGPDALLETMTSLDAALVLSRLAHHLTGEEAARVDRRAAEAAAKAVGLIHQRDYRFLLRTKAAELTALSADLARWGVGSSFATVPATLAPASADGELTVKMLGGLRVLVGGHPIGADTWKRRRARDIFAYLVSQRGRAVPRARLADLYWPHADADAAHSSLRVTITAIRKAIGDVVRFEANGYLFAAPPHTIVDVEAFDARIDAARHAVARGDAGEAERSYHAAVDLYRGEFLEGMDDGDWQWHERERLRAACLEALRWLAQRTEGDAARAALDRLLEIAPFDLEAVRMRVERLSSERGSQEARRDFDRWRERYRAIVGTEPPDLFPAGTRRASAVV
jgi:ATP/maltotriose-dependent transcriptional regulator MalT/DNA-binding SARP family transcriptional activator